LQELSDEELIRRVEFAASVGGTGAPIDGEGARKAQTSALLLETRFAQRQAEAAERAAKATERYTRYMFWSVIAILISAVLTLVVGIIRC
jgi:hypothetical protein